MVKIGIMCIIALKFILKLKNKLCLMWFFQVLKHSTLRSDENPVLAKF